ncbi:ATP-binding protein [Heliophilum fasciatum]|uniref:4Fe-4S binding protein n=1 Tax=Heliophilum fasciatum TaxID=35700 RepID=A0A4V2SX53_9FIRM|nr:4Fe-4S binding protein [Heliophilum fasciatum]MCW2277597.1 NAD-dependent dihydropyrimidine dehydrogenase PreA subunit [Heliophilum fasciatum]TCP64946.1 4Fe-4S binding protein [Heliophilum fasciatum]
MTQQMREIIRIDEEKCNGCGLCVPSCAEGALQIIDGKARIVKDSFCDGLGACLGECPQGALSIEKRLTDAFDEEAVHEHMKTLGKAAPAAPAASHDCGCGDGGHSHHAYHSHQGHHAAQAAAATPAVAATTATAPAAEPPRMGGCPGSALRMMQREKAAPAQAATPAQGAERPSELTHWPVQLKLVPVQAPFFEDARLVVAADCAAFAYADFHQRFLQGKSLVIACPKLDDIAFYRQKLTQIFRQNRIRSIDVIHMEVPCCTGLVHVVQEALNDAGRGAQADAGLRIPLNLVKIGIAGQVLAEQKG